MSTRHSFPTRRSSDLQLAQAVATLANDGVMFRPHLVNYIENPITGERTHVEPEASKTIALKARNLEVVKRAMVGVNRSEEHTSELQSPDHLVCRLLLE